MVRELLDTPVAPGHHRVTWDGRDDGGERVGSGVYFYRLEGGEGLALTRSMTLLK
jgi:flagellar hook assembly protein FlgD